MFSLRCPKNGKFVEVLFESPKFTATIDFSWSAIGFVTKPWLIHREIEGCRHIATEFFCFGATATIGEEQKWWVAK